MLPLRHFALPALLVLTACEPLPSQDPVVLALGDDVVRRSDFDRHVADVAARGTGPLDPAVRRALVEPFLEERVLVLSARARGLVGKGAPPQEEQLAVQRLLREATDDVAVADAEIAAYYESHVQELVKPQTVTVRQIVVSTPNEARDIRRRLQMDPKQFEALAQTRSRAPEAGQGGLMGTFAPGQLPEELAAVAFDLPPGEASEVVKSPLGYHVLRVDARTEAVTPSREDAQQEVKSLLLRQKSEERIRAFVRELMARAKVNHEAVNPPSAT